MLSTTVRPADHELRSAVRLALVMALLKIAVHLLSARWQSHIGYGYFRDEFYYVMCGRRLAWGYVDHGPLVAVQARASELLFGHSLAGLRFLSSVGGAARVFLTGLLAWSLGGRRPAQFLGMLMVLTAPMYLGQDSVLSMNSWESAFWLTCLFALVQVARGRSAQLWWVVFGCSAGLGLLNKPSMTFFLVALGIGLLLTPQRRMLFTRHAAVGIVLMVLVALPNLLWQMHHGWATLEFLHNGRVENKNTHLPPLAFVWNQVNVLGIWSAFVWVPGLVRALRRAGLRWLGFTFVAFLTIMIALGAKDYYAVPIYPVLFALGGVAWQQRFAGRMRVQDDRLVAFPIFSAACVLFGIVIAPVVLPVMSPATFVRYAQALHLPSSNAENTGSGVLPQFYADRYGWQEEVNQVQRVVSALPPDDRSRAAILCDNYGEAGALDFLGHDLPPVLSGHNTYWLWGTHGAAGDVLILIENTPVEKLQQFFREVQIVGNLNTPYAMPYERRNKIYLVRGPKFGTLATLWPKKKDYI